MAISFNNIPNTKIPGVYSEFDNTNAIQGLNTQVYRVLIMGQTFNGTMQEGAVSPVFSKDHATKLAGIGSDLERTLHAFIDLNSFTELHALAFDDPSNGVATVKRITIDGTTDESGSINLYIGGRAIRVPVPKDYSSQSAADLLDKEINKNQYLPFISSRSNNVITLTAKNKSIVANEIDVRLNYFSSTESTPDGFTVTIEHITNGGGVPDMAPFFANLGDTQYHIIVNPYSIQGAYSHLNNELTDRWEADRQIEGHAISVHQRSVGELLTIANRNNSKHLTIFGTEKTPTPPDELAAAIGAQVAFHAAIDPARPFQTLPLRNILPETQENQFNRTEREQLINAGYATIKTVNGTVQIERMTTTHTNGPSGAPDISYMDANILFTLSFLRFDFNTYFSNKYPRHKLGDDSKRYGAGQPIMTPKLGMAEALNRFKLWEEAGLVEDFDQFKQDLIVERNSQDPNRLDFNMFPNLINGLRVVANKISFIL